MFRGFSSVSVDTKGRMAIPARYRDLLAARGTSTLVATVNPWDRCLWLYPLHEWNLIDAKLLGLPDGDKESRRAKQVIRGQATDCVVDAQGRVLLPQELRAFAGISRRATFLGQGNKFEVWDEEAWTQQREEWLQGVDSGPDSSSSVLNALSL